MNAGSLIRIPESVTRPQGKEMVQPGLPGAWSIWSQAGGTPGAHFVVPVDAEARATGVKHATVRIVEPAGETARVSLLAVEPGQLMPKPYRAETASR